LLTRTSLLTFLEGPAAVVLPNPDKWGPTAIGVVRGPGCKGVPVVTVETEGPSDVRLLEVSHKTSPYTRHRQRHSAFVEALLETHIVNLHRHNARSKDDLEELFNWATQQGENVQ